jgi:hypothetical protein
MKTIFLPGRWQAPGGPHAGHRYLIEKAIEEGYRVIIGVRDIPKNDKDPHDVETRMAQFRKLYGKRVSFVTIPEDGDGLEVWYGRGVGWEIKEIEVPDSIRKISGTSLRKLEESTRNIVENLRMVYVDCDSEECSKRDVKGMWAKAAAGEIKGFTGYDAPFEPPKDAELTLKTKELDEEECIRQLMNHFGL